MTMPELTGEDLSSQIKAIRPDIPVILCTGFSKKHKKNGQIIF
jgi:FixJ family two-component response regulator